MKDILYIAHRGLHDEIIPENSLAAIKKAIDNHVAVEIDIQLTKDMKVVVFHDRNLKRLTGFDANVANLTYQEITKLYLKDTNEQIPLLEDVLILVQGKIILDIEIKNYKRGKKCAFIASKILQNYKGQFFIKSFNPLIAKYYKKISPQTKCGVLVGNYPTKILGSFLKKLKYIWFYKPDFVCYSLKTLNPEIINNIQKENIPLWTYGIKNEEDLNRAKRFSKAIVYENIKKSDKNRTIF